jgi:hypothetical protein
MLARVLLLSLTACGALSVQIDEPRICQTLPVALPVVSDGGAASASANFSIPIEAPVAQPGERDVTLVLTDVTLSRPNDGGPWGTLDSAVLLLRDPTAAVGAPDVAIIDYQRDPQASQGDAISMTGTGVNLAPHIQGGVLPVQLQVQGELPALVWTATAQICFHLSATLDYAQASSTK